MVLTNSRSFPFDKLRVRMTNSFDNVEILQAKKIARRGERL